MAKYIPVGIYNNELYMTENIKDTDICGRMMFDVIRPVSVSDLEHYQSDDYIYDYCEELWRMRVANDKSYTGGLDDFVEAVKSEEGNYDELYPGKDESFCGVLDSSERIYDPLEGWDDYMFENDELMDKCEAGEKLNIREFVDAAIEFNTGEAVGTWEASGCYSPHESGDYRKYVKFDYVINEEVANKWYEQVGLK